MILRSSSFLPSRVGLLSFVDIRNTDGHFAGWKRLLLSDGPRQTINALTLYSIYLAKKDNGPWYTVSKYFAGNSISTSGLILSTLFTFVIFAGSLLLLICAGICYIPLLCYIQGNLKVGPLCSCSQTDHLTLYQEYVCHKVDKVGITITNVFCTYLSW